MTSQEILRADLLDLLFDNRNKDYGAYTLRKFYARRLGLALGLALSIMLLVFMCNRLRGAAAAASTDRNGLVVTAIEIPKVQPRLQPPPPPQRSVAPPPPQAKANFTTHIALRIDPPPMASQEDLQGKLVSNINTDGPSVFTSTATPITGAGIAPVPAEPPAPAKEVLVQREPEFPGGAKAWANFLQRNLRTPDELESGERKTVLIRFQVAADGAVTGFEVLQSGGQSFDDEVIRVLRRMPKWMPALVNSQPVARSFTQPVIFTTE